MSTFCSADVYPCDIKTDLLVKPIGIHTWRGEILVDSLVKVNSIYLNFFLTPLDRMGVMYMLKLCHDEFGCFAGTCWRMIFVYALAPWMRKYRISDGTMEVLDFRFAASRKWTGRMPSGQTNDQQTTEYDNLISDLTKQNKLLKEENDTMRSLLLQYQSADSADGRVQRRFSN